LVVLGVMGMVVIPTGLIGITFGFPLAAAYRARQRRRLRRQLAGFSRAEQVALLTPLLQAPVDDTRKLVAPLVRELGAASELTPAGAPGGSGSEALPAGPLTTIERCGEYGEGGKDGECGKYGESGQEE